MKQANNKVVLLGKLVDNLKFSHSIKNARFYKAKIRTIRKSGVCDEIPIIVSDRIMEMNRDWEHEFLRIHGEYRSRNDNGHLRLYVFVLDIEPVIDADYENEISLNGYICKKPYYREMPLEREITDILIAVNRGNGRTDYIPCIAWGRTSVYAATLDVGTRIRINGRIQSREYEKKLSETETEKRTAYEVSVLIMEVVDENSND